jgi:hypothetical protein
MLVPVRIHLMKQCYRKVYALFTVFISLFNGIWIDCSVK